MVIYYGQNVLPLIDDVVAAYAEVFSEPPWNEGEESIHQFRDRLTADTARPGFRAAVTPSEAPGTDGVGGFATAWLTADPLPAARAYPQVTRQLGPDRVKDLLAGALEIDELAVRRHARPTGLGRFLLAELTADAPSGRAWIFTARRATDTMATYRRLGWHEVKPLPGTQNGVAVFLNPSHPGAKPG
jgi:GNAT superfamily N-acetyltransferase